jgi:Yip1 domain
MERVARSPWLDILTKPRETIRHVVDENPHRGLRFLYFLYGLPFALNMAQSLSLGSHLPIWAIVVGSVVLAMVFGWVGICLLSGLFFLTGKWIKGVANFSQVRAAVAWSSVPNIATILMWILLLGVFGARVFHKEFAESPFMGHEASVIFAVFFVQTIASIWGFVILLQALGEVQGFSAWKALINVLIPFVILLLITWGIGHLETAGKH